MRMFPILLALAVAARAEEAPLTLEKTIPLAGVHGRLDHMTLDAKGKRLWIAALGNDSVELVNVASGESRGALMKGKEPQGVLALPGGGLVMSFGGDGSICIATTDEDADAPQLFFPTDDLDDADNVRFDLAAGLVYVGGADGELAVIDPQAHERVAAIKLDGHPESFQLEAKGDRAFVNVPAKQEVEVVDRKKREVVARWPLADAASNFPMALDEPGGRLYVGCRRPAKILVLDAASGKPVAALDAPGDADDIFWDAPSRRLFVSGGDGTVAVFTKGEGDTFAAAPPTKTREGARTSLLSPDGKRLFVAVPERDGKPAEIRVYAVKASSK